MAAYKGNPARDLTPRIWNLYVVRLNDDASKYNHKSATHDNNRKNSGRCVYVGCTNLTPEKRLEWHKNDQRNTKNVRKEYFEFLMMNLYEHLNIGDERELETYTEATIREEELAKSLESRGFIVWCYT